MAESQDTTTYFSNFANTGPGLGSVGSYLVSGTPWVTGSDIAVTLEHKIIFPSVTKEITIWNKSTQADTPIFIHFDSKADSADVIGQHHYIELAGATPPIPANSQLTLNVKCNHLFISHGNAGGSTAAYEIMAALTGIGPAEMFELTGSGINSGP